MGERNTLANLMLLDMTDFDVILGKDWLASCHVTLDCSSKTISFSMPGELAFSFQVDRSETPSNLISKLGARRLLRKGCQGYLALVKDVEMETASLNQVLVVREFPNVFPRLT